MDERRHSKFRQQAEKYKLTSFTSETIRESQALSTRKYHGFEAKQDRRKEGEMASSSTVVEN